MSADNWGECPRCTGAVKKQLTEAYGKVSIEEYEKLQRDLEEVPANTLREDYEIGIRNEVFSVSYHASCQYPGSLGRAGCGFQFQFTHRVPVMK